MICDFGLSRGVAADDEPTELTSYVVTRWYRAPELLGGCKSYDAAVDMWSVGCILAEILGRRPLFPGKNYNHQLQVIVSIIGSPSKADLEIIENPTARATIVGMGAKKKVCDVA